MEISKKLILYGLMGMLICAQVPCKANGEQKATAGWGAAIFAAFYSTLFIKDIYQYFRGVLLPESKKTVECSIDKDYVYVGPYKLEIGMFPKGCTFEVRKSKYTTPWVRIKKNGKDIGAIYTDKNAGLVANMFGPYIDYATEYNLYKKWVGKAPNGLTLKIGEPSKHLVEDFNGKSVPDRPRSGLYKKE